MSCAPVECGSKTISIKYIAATSVIPEKVCIQERTEAQACFQTFDKNEVGAYYFGTLIIHGFNAYYDETMQQDPVKASVHWRLESRGPDQFEFTRTVQHSNTFSAPRVTTHNTTYRLSR